MMYDEMVVGVFDCFVCLEEELKVFVDFELLFIVVVG